MRNNRSIKGKTPTDGENKTKSKKEKNNTKE